MTYSPDVLKLNPSLQENKDLARVNGILKTGKEIAEKMPVINDAIISKALKNVGLTAKKGNKYGAIRSYSELCGRMFDSKAEKAHGEELFLRLKAGDIDHLEYQVKFVLCKNPRITVTIDFCYDKYPIVGKVYEDVKGVLTRDSRTKYAWLAEKHGIQVRIIR